MTGTVLFGANNSFSVLPDGSDQALRCSLKGKKLKGAEGFYNPLAAGDRVEWEGDGHGEGVIQALLPRSSLFWRFNEKGKSVQAIAANMDLVVCVSSAGLPPFRPRFIDRVSLEPVGEGLPFLIVLNKADLGLDEDARERLDDYRRVGFEVLETSVHSGQGVPELRERMRGRCSAFVGQSGVGKSSLLNALEPGLGFRVGEVCEKYARGRHTTVAAVLATLSDGATRVIDTPGFRRLAVRGIDPMSLSACFPELKAAQVSCRLGARCRHEDEPGCGVLAALEGGLIHPDRYESYLRILSELDDNPAYERKRSYGRKSRSYLNDDEDHDD